MYMCMYTYIYIYIYIVYSCVYIDYSLLARLGGQVADFRHARSGYMGPDPRRFEL